MIGKVVGHIECNSIEEKNRNKYLVWKQRSIERRSIWKQRSIKNIQNVGLGLKMRLKQ